MKHVAIIGGGPAGALAGAELAAGCRVTVYDEKLAWEKPCGGGLTQKALARYPFLKTNSTPKKLIRLAILSSPRASVELTPPNPVCIYSRRDLNGLLLDRADQAGCDLVQDRIISFERAGNSWRLRGRNSIYAADFVILASGARNRLRASDCAATAGYFVPGTQEVLEIHFLEAYEGYIWVFPRVDHVCVGICGRLGAEPASRMKERLHRYMDERGLRRDGAVFFSHLLPSLGPGVLQNEQIAGDDWAAAGDAAGLADSITGEGIYYALRSGELLASCILEERAEQYPRRLRSEIGLELEKAAQISRRFYFGKFLGDSIPSRMVQIASRSRALRAIVADLFAGSQGYIGLKQRLRKNLPAVLADLAGFGRGEMREAS